MWVENKMCSVLGSGSVPGRGSVLDSDRVLGNGSVLAEGSVLWNGSVLAEGSVRGSGGVPGCCCAGSGPHLGFSGPGEEHAGLEATGPPVLRGGSFGVGMGLSGIDKFHQFMLKLKPTDPIDI